MSLSKKSSATILGAAVMAAALGTSTCKNTENFSLELYNVYLYRTVVIFLVLLLLLIWALIEKCWHKYCKDMSTTAINNNSQENMLMMSTNQSSACTSRDGLQNYGSNSSRIPSSPQIYGWRDSPVPSSPVINNEDRPPTYEEAMTMR